MLPRLNIKLSQGIELNGACFEMSGYTGTSYKAVQFIGKRTGDEITETETETDEGVSSISFTGRVWVSEAARQAGKPPFELLDADGKKEIEIDFEKHEVVESFFNRLGNLTRTQAIEKTVEHYVQTVLVNELRR